MCHTWKNKGRRNVQKADPSTYVEVWDRQCKLTSSLCAGCVGGVVSMTLEAAAHLTLDVSQESMDLLLVVDGDIQLIRVRQYALQ